MDLERALVKLLTPPSQCDCRERAVNVRKVLNGNALWTGYEKRPLPSSMPEAARSPSANSALRHSPVQASNSFSA